MSFYSRGPRKNGTSGYVGSGDGPEEVEDWGSGTISHQMSQGFVGSGEIIGVVGSPRLK